MTSYPISEIEFDDKLIYKDIEYLQKNKEVKPLILSHVHGLYEGLTIYENSKFLTNFEKNIPNICSLLKNFFYFDTLKTIKLYNLKSAIILPHKEYIENFTNYFFYNLLLPLETNNDILYSDESGVFQIKKGEIWFFDNSLDNSIINLNDSNQFVLKLEFISFCFFYPENFIINLKKIKKNFRKYFFNRKTLTDKEVDFIKECIFKIVDENNYKVILFNISKFHFFYDIYLTDCYDWIIDSTKNNYNLQNLIYEYREYLIFKRSVPLDFNQSELKSYNSI